MIALEEFTTKGLITVETLHCERVKKDQSQITALPHITALLQVRSLTRIMGTLRHSNLMLVLEHIILSTYIIISGIRHMSNLHKHVFNMIIVLD